MRNQTPKSTIYGGLLFLVACGASGGCDQKAAVSQYPTTTPPQAAQATPQAVAPPPSGGAAPAPAPASGAAPSAATATSSPASPATAAAPVGAPAASATPSATSGIPLAQPPANKSCEVEFFGSVKYSKPLPAGQKFWVYAVQGDCLGKNPHVLGVTPVNPEGRFGYEVFSKWGADLSFCAGLAASADQPVTIYGKAPGKFHAEAEGEVIFRDIEIAPKPGPTRTYPTRRAAFEGAPAGHMK